MRQRDLHNCIFIFNIFNTKSNLRKLHNDSISLLEVYFLQSKVRLENQHPTSKLYHENLNLIHTLYILYEIISFLLV